MSQASQLSFVSNNAGQIVIAATTASISTSTGALIVRGGVGIAGDLNVGGVIYNSGSPVPSLGQAIATSQGWNLP